MSELPTGTVTLLFTDIEGSTKLLQTLGHDTYAAALSRHSEILRQAFSVRGGYEVDSEGDAFFVAFSRAKHAVAAAGEAQHALAQADMNERFVAQGIDLQPSTPEQFGALIRSEIVKWRKVVTDSGAKVD